MCKGSEGCRKSWGEAVRLWKNGPAVAAILLSVLRFCLRQSASDLLGLDCLEIGFKVFEEKSRRKAEVLIVLSD